MNTRRNVDRRLEEEVVDARAPSHDEKVPPLEENINIDQASTNPPPMTEVEMRVILVQMVQGMTTQ